MCHNADGIVHITDRSMEENTQPCTIEEDENDHDEEVLNMSAEIDEEKQLAALRMALTVPVLLTGGQSLRETRDNISQELGVVELERTTTNVDIPVDWPRVLDEEATSPELTSWPNLGSTTTIAECESWIKQHGKIILKTITWNLAAKLPPVQDATSQLLSPNRYHIYVIGTEECERSIAASAINPSKKQWEEYLGGALGSNYVPLRSHTLQAIHLIIFAHRCAASLCTEITSAAVATGIANTLGNKGGVAISMMIGSTKFVFANAHLAAHQNAVKRRNFEYEKLRKDLPQLLLKKETKNRAANLDGKVSPVLQGHWGITNETNAASSDQNTEQILAVVDPPSSGTVRAVPQDNSNSNPDSMLLENCADRVIFMGDLNYRIRGNRQAVDKLLESGMHDVMLANDQLKWSMNSGRVLANFTGKTALVVHYSIEIQRNPI